MELFTEILKAIVLGIVQGITEWLPISSTGHMILVDEFLQLAGDKQFVDLFLVVVQFGSILAVVLLLSNPDIITSGIHFIPSALPTDTTGPVASKTNLVIIIQITVPKIPGR